MERRKEKEERRGEEKQLLMTGWPQAEIVTYIYTYTYTGCLYKRYFFIYVLFLFLIYMKLNFTFHKCFGIRISSPFHQATND